MDTFDIGDGALIRAGIGEFRWHLLRYTCMMQPVPMAHLPENGIDGGQGEC